MGNKKSWVQKIKHGFHWVLEHTLGHVITLPIVTLLIFTAGWIIDEVNRSRLISYVSDHPVRGAAALLIVGLLITAIYRGIGYLKIYIRNREILASVGVSSFWPHANSIDKQMNWQSCQNRILADHPNELRILGATGWETFGKPESPLHDIVDAPPAILLDTKLG